VGGPRGASGGEGARKNGDKRSGVGGSASCASFTLSAPGNCGRPGGGIENKQLRVLMSVGDDRLKECQRSASLEGGLF